MAEAIFWASLEMSQYVSDMTPSASILLRGSPFVQQLLLLLNTLFLGLQATNLGRELLFASSGMFIHIV
jgi:hypothetical protein